MSAPAGVPGTGGTGGAKQDGGRGGRGATDAPVRVGRIEFINCFPLYLHFEEELARLGVSAEVVGGTPAELNRLLVAGEIDVALPSSIEYARHGDKLVLLPGISISSFGAVDSIQLFATSPREELSSIALSEKSATSTCLLRVLCREWGVTPEFAERSGSLADVLARFDGLLLIGDEALHVLRAGVYPRHFDLGEEWRSLTGLPMVYAVCAARRDFAAASPTAAAAVEAALVASRDRCAADPEATAAAAARLYDFSQAYLEGYFDRLKFGFTDEYRRGLEEFYRRAVAIDELDTAPDLGSPPVLAS
ncbi:MAG TPA: menaquinone biosynthesis protein [Thermoleophilia bacterium]|nr:menaquinone biosynthesis protein [Thermoleophilia bacterium]